MAIHVSPEVNNLLLLLIGEKMLQADEDKAYRSHEPYDRLGKQLTKLSELIEDSVIEVGRSLPPQVATRYVRAMNMFVDDGGRNYLKEFADELDVVARGRVETSINITEAKWQIIAEIVRLLIELAVILVMSVFSGGATAGKAAVARAQSRVTVLAILDQLMKRTHLMPSLSEAFDEAFTTFAVRLALIAFGPDGRRPKGFDWSQILQDAVFGGITGMFHGVFEGVADRLRNFFRRSHLDDTVFKKFDEDVLTKVDRGRADLPSSANNRDFGNRDIGRRDLGNRDLGNRDTHDRDGFGDDIGDAVAEGAAETFGEFVTVGLFTGSWALSGDTFLTATGSALFMGMVFAGAAKFGSQFNIHLDTNALNDVRALDADAAVRTRSTKETPAHDTVSESGGARQEDRSTTPTPASPGGSSGTPGPSSQPRNIPTTSASTAKADDTEESPVHDVLSESEGGSEDAGQQGQLTAPTPTSSGGQPHAPGTSSQPRHTPTLSRDEQSGTPETEQTPETDPTPVTATASHAPTPSSTTGTHAPAPTPVSAAPVSATPVSATPVTPSPTASQPRPVTQTVPFPGHEDDLRVLDVVGDGDCFFTSLLAGLHHQGHGSALTAMDVPQLRQHAADRFHGSERYRELNERDALDVLVQDLDSATLSAVLGTPPPPLSPEQNATVDSRLRDQLYGQELRRRVNNPADRAVLADLNQATIRALLPQYQPDPGRASQEDRARLARPLQVNAMRNQLREALTGDDRQRAEELWTRLLERRYERWAEQRPRLADFRDRRLGDLVTDSIRSTDLWATPFFDYAPSEVAHALDLNVTVVEQRQGAANDTPLNSGAGRPVYLHYNGRDHYSAVENSPAPTVAPAPEAPAEEPFVRPATTSSDRVEELVSLLRGQDGLGVEDRTLDRLRTLSSTTVDALLGGGGKGAKGAEGAKGKGKPPNNPPGGKAGKGGKGGNSGKPEKGGKGGKPATESSSSAPGPAYKTVLTHPGYATGDQFGIAAALHGDPNLHVLVDSAAPGTDARDKGPEIAEFYRSSGIAPERIHFQQGPHDRTAKQRSEEIVREINAGAPDFDKLSKTKLNNLSVPVGTGTTWIGDHFSHPLRDTIRKGWRLDDTGFPPEDRAKVAAWLAGRDITVEPGRKVIVLWSRFSGKRGDIHVEHDTSYTGMDQLLTGIHERTKDDPPGPLVIIAGDAKVNPQRPDHYPALTAKHWNNGLAVHDLTDFWNDREGVATWGGDTRTGQMRLYEYLNRQSGGDLKHLGFRSGNLEAMALSGHQVRYLEEPGSIGGERMAKWHAANSKSAVKTGYERITIVRPPTLSGQIAVEAQAVWEKTEKEYGKKPADPVKADELKNRETAFKHPAWVVGKNNRRGAEKPYKDPKNRGFHDEDVKEITKYLVGGPRPEPTRLVSRPVTGGRRLQTLADGDVPDSAVNGYGLGEARGQASFTPADWSRRERRYPTVTTTDDYSDHRPQRRVLVGGPKDVPWKNRKVSFFAAHGKPTRVELALDQRYKDGRPQEDGVHTVTVSGRELGRYMVRWGGLGPDGEPIVLYSCSTGASPTHGGLPVAQHVANVTGRPVYAPTTKVGTALDGSGRVRPILDVESETGEVEPGRWRLFLPEPSGPDLTALARAAGQHEGDGEPDHFAALRTLQFVRTLRGTTGLDTGSDHELLRGLGALERLRWHRDAPPRYTDARMTPDLLTRITRDTFRLPDTAAPTPEQYRAVLAAATTAAPGTAPDRLPVQGAPAGATGVAHGTGPDADEGGPARDPLWEGGGNGSKKASGSGASASGSGASSSKLSKEEKAALHAKKAEPDPGLKKVLHHPGYATGDQFGIAAYLLADENLHVVVARDPLNGRDRSANIAAFYRASGIDPGRVHEVEVTPDTDGDAHAKRIFDELNAEALADRPPLSKSKLRSLVLGVGAGTEWITDNFSTQVREQVRAGWRLDDAGFPGEQQEKVAAWLAAKGVQVDPGRKVIVLWSRFSGKRGDVHVEHDTSYKGMGQILRGIRERTKDDRPGPLVIITGDARVDERRRPRYPDLVRDPDLAGLAVHDLTDFWNDREGVATWGGDTRTGQMRLFEYLNRQSGGDLKHLGFRSGNLEAMALSGHRVNYLEEPDSFGGERMAKWNSDNHKAKATLKTGYERIVIDRPPTLSGRVVLEARAVWEQTKELHGKTPTTSQKEELNSLAEDFKHPAWVRAGHEVRRHTKSHHEQETKGFSTPDIDKIVTALLAPAPVTAAETPVHGAVTEGLGGTVYTSGDRRFNESPVVGDGDCCFRALLDSARLQDPQAAPLGENVRELRNRAADAFTGTAEHALLNQQDALEELTRDLSTAQLRRIVGGPLPGLPAPVLARIEERLTDVMYRAELLRRTDAADSGVLADLPRAAVRALLPGYRPDPADAPAADRDRLMDAARGEILRPLLQERLTQDGPAAETAWRTLLEVGYPRWARTGPRLDSVRGHGVGDLVTDSLRDVNLWNTPFFDHAPGLVARALGVRLVVVRSDGGPDQEYNPDGTRTVHVLYNGVDHYSALAPAEGDGTTEGPQTPVDSEAAAPVTGHEDIPGSGTSEDLTDLVAFLRAQAPDTTDRTLDGLRRLTPGTLAALRASGGETPPPPRDPATELPTSVDPFADLEAELDTHRPPRLDRSLLPPPPPPAGKTVTFTDGSALPSHLDEGAYGHSRARLRGTDQVVREIGERAALPEDVRARLEQALRATPQAFHGDGWLSPPFTDSRGRTRVMRVRTRPHGVWERFTDAHGVPVKVDAGHRSQVTSGPSRTVAQTKRLAGSLPIGPPAGPVAYGRIGAAVSYGRSYDYAMQEQTLSQVETRRLDGSHLHLDDVQYEVSFEGAPTAARKDRLPRGFATGEGHFTFGVRNGLTLRLPEGETRPGEPGPVPRTLSLGPRSDYRLVHTEGYGPVEAIRKWALDRTGALPGSTAHQELSGFFSTDAFHRMADRLARGKVPTRQLLGEDKSRSPLGAFVVEKVVPGRAELLTETEAAELRNTVQQTVKNERGLTKSYGFEVSGSIGPSVDLANNGPFSVRLLAGAVGRYARGITSGQVFGGSGGRKIVGRAKKVPTELYKVHKTVWVRRTGDQEATPFQTWSLDRMTRTEARRLAGWDDGATLRKRHGNEPLPPVYLTDDDPAVLGMARPEAFTSGDSPTLLQEFTDEVIRAAARRHPGLIAPLAELEARTGRWSDPERYRLALANTLAVVDALSHHSLAGGLEAVVTTGLRIPLTGTGHFGRSHRYLWIDGRLTDRRYEGTQNDLILRGGSPGTERLDGSRSGSRTLETGFDAGLALRDKGRDGLGAPKNLGNLTAGPRWAWQKGRKTGYGSTASYEGLAVSALPSHLHSYQLELTAKSGGHWRPRTLWRGLPSFGLLGTGLFVRGETETDLVGGRAGAAVRGRVLLSVPDEHTPVSGTPAPRTAPDIEELTATEAADLAAGRAPHEDPFGDHPYQTVSVGGHKRLGELAEEVMGTASGGSWHFARPGAPAHDAMLRPFQPQYLAAEFDQTSGPGGSLTGGLFGKGPYLNRLGDLVHRTRVVRPVVVSKPVKVETEQTLGSDTQSSGAVTTSTSFTVTGGGGYGTTHPAGPSLAGSYGLLGRWSRSRGTTHTVTRTVTSELDRDDENFKVLVSGDTRHEILASSRADGVLSPAHDLATRFRSGWVGKRVTFAADWLGHLPEKAAHRLGLLRDKLGEVPRYTARTWSRPGWLRDNPFGSYPVNALDTTAVLTDFDTQLLALNADDASRARVRSLVTPRAVRALRDRMTSPSGAAAPARIGRLNLGKVHFGGRTGALKVELIQGDEEFDGLDHSTTLQDTRVAAETVESGTMAGRGWGAGLTVGEGIRTGAGGAPASGPALTTSGSVDRTAGTARSTTRWKSYVFYPNEPHAEFVTPYRMRLTLTLDDGRVAESMKEVG
ncbi:hypothetical protein AB0G40_31780, partial [Streptomyces griseorubiginosus]